MRKFSLVLLIIFAAQAAFAVPTIGQVIVNSTNGNAASSNLAGTDENLTAVLVNPSPGTYGVYDWRKNGAPITKLNMPFEGGSTSAFTKDYSTNGYYGAVIGG